MTLVHNCFFCEKMAVMYGPGCLECIQKIVETRLVKGPAITCRLCEQEKPAGNLEFSLCRDCTAQIKHRWKISKLQAAYDRKHRICRCGGGWGDRVIRIYRLPKDACRICREIKLFANRHLRICEDCVQLAIDNKAARIQAHEDARQRQQNFSKAISEAFGKEERIFTATLSKTESDELARRQAETSRTLEMLDRVEGKECALCKKKSRLADDQLKLCKSCVEVIVNWANKRKQPKEIAT